MVRHFAKPKAFSFPTYEALTQSKLRVNRWTPQLISSAQITSLYSQEPWKILVRADRSDLLSSDWVVQGIGRNVSRV